MSNKPLDRHRSVRQALKYVERNPEWPEGVSRLEMPVWEFIARNLFDIANYPDARLVGSINRSVRAQRIILDRLTGTRRMGTHPAVRANSQIQFGDLTQGYLEKSKGDDDE